MLIVMAVLHSFVSMSHSYVEKQTSQLLQGPPGTVTMRFHRVWNVSKYFVCVCVLCVLRVCCVLRAVCYVVCVVCTRVWMYAIRFAAHSGVSQP